MKRLNLDGLIAIGGNDTLTVASRLADDLQLNIIGIPQTIDNDVLVQIIVSALTQQLKMQ